VRCSILMAFNDSSSSRSALDFLCRMRPCYADALVTLLHVLRKPSGSEEMMGKKFVESAPARMREKMEKARQKLIDSGFSPENISIKLIDRPYPTVGEGILEQVSEGQYNMVVIGRKKMSKAEEFVLGDPSIRLVRALEGIAVTVVKQ
jgi:nucleotide-binding universal stress UspA family protein